MANTTWNPSDKSAQVTLSNGNLTAVTSATNTGVRAIDGQFTGKFYFEVTTTTWTAAGSSIGVSYGGASFTFVGNGTGGIVIRQNGSIFSNNTQVGTGTTSTSGSLVCVAIDINPQRVLLWSRVGAAGVWNNNAANDPAAGIGGAKSLVGGQNFYPVVAFNVSTDSCVANFGQNAFSGAVPSGFTAGWPTNPSPTLYAETTQAAVEEWASITPPQMQLTQDAVEEWATVATVVGTNYNLPAAQGSYALSGAAHSLYGMGLYGAGLYSAATWGVELGVGMPAAQGAYALNGQAATLVHSASYGFLATAGSYALAGHAATLTATIAVHYTLGGAPGSYALAGQAAALTKLAHGQYALIAPSGPYALTGGTVTMGYTPAALVGKAQKPYLREGTYRVRQLGWAFDPTFVLRKNRPGPIRIIEFDGWMN